MSQINPTLPAIGQPDSTEEPKIVTALSQLISTINNLDSANIADGSIQPVDLQAALADVLGINTGVVRRGKSIVATSEVSTNVAYGLMPTPDRVQSVVLPTDGLLAVAYIAEWQQSVANACRAAIFLNGNQIQLYNGGAGGPAIQAAPGSPTQVATWQPLVTTPTGLVGVQTQSQGGSPATTGMILGGWSTGDTSPAIEVAGGNQYLYSGSGGVQSRGPSAGIMYLFAGAGTYDISVQFKVSSGSVTVKNRKLWVWTMGF